MGDKEDTADTRIEFMQDYLLKSLKLKAEKWNKFITGDERHVLYRYFDIPKFDIIVFRVNTAGLLTCATQFPPISRGKMCVTVGEISGNVIQDLSVMADEVIGPLLCNPGNQKGWPKIVRNDMKRHVDELRSLFHQLKGEMSSQVMLPMPAGVENIFHAEAKLRESDGEDVDLYLKTNIEGAVIKWTQQVHDLLAEDSYIAFKRTKFPMPSADIDFYATRLKNLEGIYSQLRDPRVKRMAHYLEDTHKCRDIYVYQKPLAIHFETFEGNDFQEAKWLVRPMFHCIGLLWGNSRYYCNVEKLIPLLREVCNLVIMQCTNSIDPPTIFQGDPDEQLLKLRRALAVLKQFIDTYELNRDKVHTFFPAGVTPVRWSFDFDRVFMRFNIYVKKLRMIEEILDATCEIIKLEKVEFCGLRGKIISTECMKVLEEYTLIYQNLGNITYDPADPEDNSFLPDYKKHMGVLADVDRRLASLFTQGLDECNDQPHFIKFFQIMGDLFHRPVIKAELKPKLNRLLDYMHNNLDQTKEIFDEEMAKLTKGPERPMVDPYLPPVAGVIWWVQKLQTESAIYIKQKMNEMNGYINQVEDRNFKPWCGTVPGICKTHLAKNLIYRDPPFVRNNFAPELVMLLREIRYMKYLNKQGIPQDGLDLYARNEKLQYDMNRLNRAISWYNAIREGSHETEAINALQERVLRAQNNMLRGLANIAAWGDIPLHNRKENPDKMELRNKILESHAEFQDILVTNYKLFFNIQEDEQSIDDEEELEDVDEATLDDDEKAARAAKIREIAERREVKRLAREEREAEKAAANQIKFERREARRLIREAKEAERAERQARRDAGEEVDSPAEEEEVITDPDELADIEAEKIEMEEERFRAARWPAYVRYVDSLVSKQIMKAIEVSLNLFEKQTDLEKGPQVAFLRVVAELRDPDIYFSPSLDIDETGGLYDTLREMMKDMFLQATLFPRIDEIKYEKYTPLWMEDRHEVLENFLKYGRVIPPEEFDKYVYENGCEPPTLDLKLLNQAIMNIICKWSNLYKENLKEHVQTSLDVLEKFIIYATKELSVELGDDDYEGLLQVMRVMNEVKAKVDADTDHMFEPLRDIIDVLKEYGLEVLPDRWRNLTRLCTVMKNTIAPLQATQAGLIAKRVALINLRLNMYRDQFKDKEMFLEASKEPYRQIDKVNQELMEFDSIVEALKKSCQLFDIQPPDEKNLKQCRREKSPWKKIDADGMDQECKRLTKDLRQLDKDMRVWEPYIAIEGIIKNLMTSLRAVKFNLDDETTLADLLALNLHKYEEEVKTIVDKSVKEAAMEKTLKELEATWAVMEFDYSPHDRTGIKLPKASEELVETLEDNQNQVQNMMSSKFIGFFEVEVTAWQKKLGTADAVISLWFEVQRKWQYLESIFVGSDDIRAQLPEDSRRFDNIDKTFKELLKDIGNTPNVVASTNKAGLLDKLEELMKNLNLCEKALNDYLETKRLAYPRFYFVSSADLLDILSNGNNPPAVGRHLTKLYDNLAKLVFPKGSKHAFEMISKENEEHVPFKAPCCDCSGKVELWLNRVTDCMRYTLRDIFEHAVISYEDKPRDEWVFDWPAQPALVSTQIWWTTETNQAFEKLEEGYENALKDYQKKQIQQLNNLIVLLLGDLTVGDRQKIMTICTIDVHSRDVVAKLIVAKVDNSNAFQWQSQLRHRWDYKLNNCFANICDAQFLYDYEYLGNTPRLVITPLTDRCYITLTQSLHLIMGGLAQTGAWGCFDEFNRISVEVLSVVSVQVKSVLDAIKFKKKKFEFMGEHIILIPTVGMFITMNPGYAGRTELPENLKALFRPCAMVVPDFELICEIMLVAEGFQEARLLARKFITLYTLCRELLSKQDHYDWGLRAIKSVLVVAGSLKRGDRLRPEDQVLMRALRDFNVPKIVTDDTPVFMGLIGDLFPALDVPRKRDFDFEQKLREAAVTMKLQPEPGFILKMVQLVELFAVRHSVFIDGFAGTGKSAVWQCLNKTYHMMKLKPFYNDLDPKAVTNDELFGIINPATREWRDGLFSTIMRDMANMPGDGPKWIVLDGDIDPMWIESLNTLMDDNKVLTLASNERIALTKPMRLLFEIANLRTATPATTTRDDESEKAMLTVMFDKYIPALLETSKKYKRITPLTDLQQIQLTCYLLECFLNKSLLPSDCPKEWYEIYFVFAVMWGFGSGLFQDQLVDWRNEFSKWFCNEFKQIKFPSTGNVFSFFIDPETKKFLPWSERVEKFDLDPDLPLQSCLVSTSETTRIRFFMDLLITKQKPVMLVGSAGSGKTVSVAAKLNALPDSYAITNAPLNFYTTSEMIQKVLEKPLEKKSGRNFGPPGSKFMIYFVDDLNMPEVDTYGTVQPHTLIREFMDYKHWYDRQKLSLKEISNCMFVSCMNPTAAALYIKAGLKNIGNMFLMTDAQVAEERFLVLINDLLASGEIPELLADDEIENIINGVRGEVVLCFSPVGATLRVRARKFPSLVNCTAINWFHEWPAEALRSVSKRFISEVEALPPFLVDPVANFMAHVHQSVNQMSAVYFQNEKRYNYTTPKTFLELISLYSKLLSEKTTNLKMMITRLENGLEKLASCAADVAVLKITLAEQEIILKVKNKAAEELIEEEKKVKVIEEDVTIKANICAADLAKAEPALLAAQEALNTLNKNNLTELKAFGSPPDAVVMVTAAVLVLFSKRGKIAKDRSWKACKAVMPYIKNPEFDPTIIASKSGAAAGLCSWVINICKFYDVFVVVEPKRKALAAANAELQAARDKLSFLTDQIKELEEKLGVLMKAFQEAVNEKMKCQAEADATNYTIDLANRLESGITLPGDVLLVSSFISYVGCFMRRYRLQLINDDWVPTLAKTNPKIESTEGLDPLSMLTDDAQVACWNNEGLPTDTMSAENATILTNSARWPLMIDPQLQGIKWIKTKYGDALVVIRLTQRNYIDRIERAVTSGNVVLLENIGETVDAVLDPLLGRVLIRKGKILKIGDREMDYHPSFRLVIQTKLANPHYQPEMQAQCTLINFTVTKDGLEEQLLGEVVKAERPDLEALRAGLTKQQNDFKITLKTLEDDLLKRLANAGADILSDSALVINLETTKKTAADIEIKVEEGKITSVKIDEAPATRASLLYFILNEIYKINPMYQFSLKAYNVVFKDALAKAEQADDLEARVRNLLDSITFCVLQSEGKVDPRELDFLLKYAVAPENSPYPWLSNNGFGGIVALAKMDAFENLDKEIEGATKSAFCEENLGTKYVEARTPPLEVSYRESNCTTAMFFILSPGVDPLKDLEKLGRKLGYAVDKKNFHIVSLGQGQEVVAEEGMTVASANGHWVILQNIHLVAKWLATLEKKMEETFEDPDPTYRLFLSAEPAGDPAYHIIPQGILESSIKITNEPPIGMWANLHKSLDNFSQETLEMCSKEAEFKSVLFALCYFHAVVAERRKFGPQGWNRVYPFNFGDLTICVYVLYNYLEANPRVPWEDLRYLFGEIMYGGHITDDWDRRLCRTFLLEYMQPELVDGECQLAPGFISPPNSDYVGYHGYIDDFLPDETPYLYGLHPNAEIGYLTTVSERLFKVVFEMQPRDTGAQSGGGATKEELVRAILEDVLDRVPEPFNLQELMGKMEELTPYTIVALQECERMNKLMGEIRRSDMEKLMESLFMDKVPDSWTKLAYPSLLGLASWFSDLCLRLAELESWSGDFN
ncbi:hypothetical protein MSG28_007028, partial [Choristoneura fumiferana]